MPNTERHGYTYWRDKADNHYLKTQEFYKVQLRVPCPTCHALIARPCATLPGSTTKPENLGKHTKVPHTARADAALAAGLFTR